MRTSSQSRRPTRFSKRFPSTRRRRKILRRALRTRCQAVAMDGFRLIGDRVLDLSPHGMLVAADAEIAAGEEMVVSFQMPETGEWIDAEAKVARVIEGWRPFDPGYAMGLQFTQIDLDARLKLREQLQGVPPPVPTRSLRAGL